MIEFLRTDWHAVGRRTLDKLPLHERDAFVKWLSDDAAMLALYERSRGTQALEVWEVSYARSVTNDMRLPEGF